jgi:hypothetical protein
VLSGRVWISAVLLALAVDFKPWAVPFAVILLAAPRRKWFGVAAIWLGVVGVVWAPFVLADPATLSAARFAIPVSPASTLRLVGLPDRVTPAWCRYAQLVGGIALAAVAVRNRRLGAAFLVTIAVRLLLDPAAKNYYDAGLLLAAGIFDLTATLSIIPYATLAAALLVYLPSYALQGSPAVQGAVRTLALLALIVTALSVRRPGGFARVPPALEPQYSSRF